MPKFKLNTDILIIGGGASGICAAIGAKCENENLNITIAERLPRIGKKILSTGNGRCNLGNVNIASEFYHGSVENVMQIISDTQDTVGFFESLGVLCTHDSEGRMYPYSNSANTVLNAMRMFLNQEEITELCDFDVCSIEKASGKFKVSNGEEYIVAEKIIIAAGGYAAPSMGTDGSMMKLLCGMGHKIITPTAAIAPLCVNPNDVKGLKGVRVKAAVSAFSGVSFLAKEIGEVQFNENNISGICIFNLAYLYPEYKNLVISLDLMPELTINELETLLLKIKKIRLQFQSEEFVSGIFNRNLSSFLIKKCHIDKTCRISEISDDKIHTLAKNIKRLEFKITASSLWKNAQITHGGICGECVDLNLQSKFFKGMYLCGEILDVDGICGGYNLTWAWSSGLWAGKNAAKKSEDIYAENK